MRCWHGYLSGAKCKCKRMARLMRLPPRHLCFSKIQNDLSFWYRPTQVVLEKRSLNDCVCVCVCACVRVCARARVGMFRVLARESWLRWATLLVKGLASTARAERSLFPYSCCLKVVLLHRAESSSCHYIRNVC